MQYGPDSSRNKAFTLDANRSWMKNFEEEEKNG
jgi:hypothetical protein